MSSESIEERDSPLIETVRRKCRLFRRTKSRFIFCRQGKTFYGKGRAAASDELWGIEC